MEGICIEYWHSKRQDQRTLETAVHSEVYAAPFSAIMFIKSI